MRQPVRTDRAAARVERVLAVLREGVRRRFIVAVVSKGGERCLGLGWWAPDGAGGWVPHNYIAFEFTEGEAIAGAIMEYLEAENGKVG